MELKTKKLTVMAVFIALSIILVYFVHFPIFPAVPFLEYDPADIPILIGTFIYGPLAGFMITCIASVIQGMTVSSASGVIGILMHIFATGSYVLIVGVIYKRRPSNKRAVIGLVFGIIAVTISMVIWNIIFTPLFLGTPIDQVLPLILPFIIPFNVLKAGVNGVMSFLLYKRLKGILYKGI